MADDRGEIKITPFDLEEELEEGEFDAEGNFIFKKEEPDDENNDTWADSVDWLAVEKEARESERAKAERMAVDKKKEEDEDQPVVRDKLAAYKQMLRIMRPDETVQKTIRRFGNLVPKRRFKTSKDRMATTSGSKESAEIAEHRKKLDIMIELAHQLLEEGDTDIYQKSYEQLEDAIN